MNSGVKFYEAFERVQDPIFIRDSKKNILYMNPAAKALAGAAGESYRQYKCFELFAAKFHRPCSNFCPFDITLSDRRTLHCKNHLIITQNGATYRATADSTPLTDQLSEIAAMISFSNIEPESTTSSCTEI